MGIQQKRTYRITNWREYNKSLVQLGDITIWFSDEALKRWGHANDQVKVGRPFVYSDTAVECLLTIRELLKLPYRQTEGFGRESCQFQRSWPIVYKAMLFRDNCTKLDSLAT